MTENRMLEDRELEHAVGGTGGWQAQARGSSANCGGYIVYTAADGDRLSGVAARFGVTEPQIRQWNGMEEKDKLRAGQKLTIYPLSIR